jgi:hypothetical protein
MIAGDLSLNIRFALHVALRYFGISTFLFDYRQKHGSCPSVGVQAGPTLRKAPRVGMGRARKSEVT